MSIQIKYEVKDASDKTFDCITPCPYGCDMNVGGDSCRFDCYSFISDDELNHTVTCKGKSPEEL